MTNLLENVIVDKSKEEFLDILKHENVRIERIVSNGQSSEKDFWYEQEENEFVLLLKGSAILEFENKVMPLIEGDFIDIKAFTKHRVKYTSEDETTIWLAIFYK